MVVAFYIGPTSCLYNIIVFSQSTCCAYNYCIDCTTITGAQKLLSLIPAPQCPTLPPPLNGGVSASGGTATYTCNTGYTLSGLSTRTCQTNGAWSGTAPTCSATAVDLQCPELSPPSGGTVRLTSQAPGSGIAVYRCNTGNNLIGSYFLTCQPDGTWNRNAPICHTGVN